MVAVIASLVKSIGISELWQPVVNQVLPGGGAYALNVNMREHRMWRRLNKRNATLPQCVQVDRPLISIAIVMHLAAVDIRTRPLGAILGREHVFRDVRPFKALSPARNRGADAFVQRRNRLQLRAG